MKAHLLIAGAALMLAACAQRPVKPARSAAAGSPPATQVFDVRGVVKSIKPDGRTVVIQHEAIPGFMEAMTMPFRAKAASELKGLSPGAAIRFRFHVAEEESWMDHVTIIIATNRPAATPAASAPSPTTNAGSASASAPAPVSRSASVSESASASASAAAVARREVHPLMDYKFTNQFGRAVSLSDFRGTALGITFIFTRCPVPDYCPRLTRNFQETSLKLSRLPNAPTNWHLLSFTIDPAFDTPKILKSYAERYQYDPARWSFLTGPSEQITELVKQSGVTVEPGAGLFTHNFRTLIIAPNGQLQASIPIGGPISDGIVAEMLKAMGVTNAP